MYCSKCGEQLTEDAVFCKKCGTKVAKEKIVYVAAKLDSESIAKKNKENVWELVIGLLVMFVIAFLAHHIYVLEREKLDEENLRRYGMCPETEWQCFVKCNNSI